jgi:hypothetical protein
MRYAQGNVDIMSFALWISRGLRMRNENHSHLARHRVAWSAVGGPTDWPKRGGVGPARKGRGNGGASDNFIFIFL